MTADHRFEACALDMGHDFNGEIKIGGNYSPVVRDGKQLWVSGQIPRVGDEVLFVGVLGPRGVHTRTSVGVMQLPKGAAVELDMVATATEGSA
jgi:enamine deaminase RidA (YjgF/YER057c/UK114 family)